MTDESSTYHRHPSLIQKFGVKSVSLLSLKNNAALYFFNSNRNIKDALSKKYLIIVNLLFVKKTVLRKTKQ